MLKKSVCAEALTKMSCRIRIGVSAGLLEAITELLAMRLRNTGNVTSAGSHDRKMGQKVAWYLLQR
jgi:hypothetical protein